jgi:twitching motility protein PilT
VETNGFTPPSEATPESAAMPDGGFFTSSPFAPADVPVPVVASGARIQSLAPSPQAPAPSEEPEVPSAPAAFAPDSEVRSQPQHAAPVAAAAPAVDLPVAPVALAPAAPEPEAVPLVPDLSPQALMAMEAAQASGPAPIDVEPEAATAVADSAGSAFTRASTEERVASDDINLNDLLIHVMETGASDLHLTTGTRPMVRLNGALRPLEDEPVLTPPVIQRVMYAAITQRQREKFEEELELDFAYSVPGRARFRVNLYRQRDAIGAAFRLIPYEIKPLESLGVPPSVANFAMLPRGFVLVTGPTGSGKSTTLAAIIDLANRQRQDHILTVEDPIEFLHRHQSSLVNQREVGEDTHSFSSALKHALRQDPDIILVGEMRDLETISVALTAAETGHLVFGTLHTQDAAQTIDRVIDVFPTAQQQQVRVQLAGALQGVVCQTLCKTLDGKGRAVATEVLVATPAIRNLVREGKTHQIYSAMQAGAQHGMHTMDQHLADLVNKGRISYEVGLEKAHHIEDFNRLSGRG